MITTVLAEGSSLDLPTPVEFDAVLPAVHMALWATTVLSVLAVLYALACLAYRHSVNDSETGSYGPLLIGGVVGALVSGAANALLPVVGGDSPSTDADTSAPPSPEPAVITPPVTTTVPAQPGPSTPPEPFDWTPVIWIGVAMAVLLVLAAVAVIVVRTRSHLARLTADAEARQSDFDAAAAVYADVAGRYADYLADPYAIFVRPELDNLDNDLTARFVDAFADAGAIRSDTCPTDPARITAFRKAAQNALTAFVRADNQARKIGMGPRDTTETRTLRRIQDALTIALDDAATPGERATALSTVHRLADGLLEIPDRITAPVRLAIEGADRKQLTV